MQASVRLDVLGGERALVRGILYARFDRGDLGTWEQSDAIRIQTGS